MDSGNRSSIKIIKSNFIISICFFYTLTIYIFDAFLADNMFKFMGNTSLMLPIKLLGLVLSFICATLYTPKISRLELFILFILFIYVSSVFWELLMLMKLFIFGVTILAILQSI